MSDQNWKAIKQGLMDLVELDPVYYATYFTENKLAPGVRSEIEELLAHQVEAGKMLDVAAIDLSRDFFGDVIDDLIDDVEVPDQQFGVYRVVRELGTGGMGTVYLAERRDGKFQQRVAIKLLKRELNTGILRDSFDREIDIQSRLVHPNVASILDTGKTDDGTPYIVMEYVKGCPIDKFCVQNGLGLIDRLKLFIKACDAVAFLHQNLIVHRDLKPSNIIVTDAGIPKILDFGISKLLESENVDENSDSKSSDAMTPEYASPEQIRGETVTTATDVYSLGVVLFKILTGSHPFESNRKSNGELLKAIAEIEPRTPSSVRTTKVEDREFRNQNSKLLLGDLDNIVLRSLNKKPENRYASVEQFSHDIWRHIDDLPVLARPATFLYRASKFFRRNRISVVAAMLIFLSLITGLAVAFKQTRVAQAQAQNAVESRILAEHETERNKAEVKRSEKISQFMAKVISYANPSWFSEGSRFGGDAKVIDALLDLSGKIDAEFAAESDVAAELHHKFGEVFLWVARDEKNPHYADFLEKRRFHSLRALQLRKQFYGERHELVAKDIWFAADYLSSSEGEKAEICAQAIQLMRETNPNNLNLPYMLEAYASRLMMPNSQLTQDIYLKAVIPSTDENKYQIAERYLLEALPIFRLHYTEDNFAIFANECRLAYALLMQEDRKDFNEHYNVCKLGEAKLKVGELATSMRKNVELVETALAQKNWPK